MRLGATCGGAWRGLFTGVLHSGSLTALSRRLGVRDIWIKDESPRFGLNAFKVLGGAYAVGKYLADRLGIDIALKYTLYGTGSTVSNFVLPVLPGWVPDDLHEIDRDGSLSWLGRFSFKENYETTVERYIVELEAAGFTVEVTPYEMFGVGGIILSVEGEARGRMYGGMLTFGGEGDENGVQIQFGERLP